MPLAMARSRDYLLHNPAGPDDAPIATGRACGNLPGHRDPVLPDAGYSGYVELRVSSATMSGGTCRWTPGYRDRSRFGPEDSPEDLLRLLIGVPHPHAP